MKTLPRILTILFILAGVALVLFGKRPTDFRLADPSGPPGNTLGPAVGNRTIVTFWEKWSRHERDAMQDIVDRFNRSQDRIFVNMVSMSNINQKMLISTAGGDPPDIAGLWSSQVAPYMASNAIEPLDELTHDNTVTPNTYKPYVYRICAPLQPDGTRRLFAASSTPSVCALYWNKTLFREAGLDPESPPRTIEELDAMAAKLTVTKGADITRAGFLPNHPGWWDYYWGIYFGNDLYDEATGLFRINTPAQQRAFTWYQSYARRYGTEPIQQFTKSVGAFATPQNPFYTGKVAMVVQGPFFAEFIRRNSPGLVGNYGVTFIPLPADIGKPGDIALGDLDVWVIPRGARHKQEALEVLRFFTRQDNMERLAAGHAKPSPLTSVSDSFLTNNPNPFIRVFEQIMLSPTVHIMPQSPVWERVQSEINQANDRILSNPTPTVVPENLRYVQQRADQFVSEFNHYHQMRQNRGLLATPPATAPGDRP